MVFCMRSGGPTERVIRGGGWNSLVKRFSLIKYVTHLTRRRWRLKDAAADSQGCTHPAVAFERKRSMAPALWACCFEVLVTKVASR